jgi:hypothetical protein
MKRLVKIFYPDLLPLCSLAVFLVFVVFNSAAVQQLDSANYYLEGMLTLHGYRPYLDFNDNKGPLLYYLLAISAWFGGWGMWAGIALFRLIDCIIFLLLANLLRACAFSRPAQALGLILFTLAYAGCFPFPDETIYSESPELLFRLLGYTLYLRYGSAMKTGSCFALAILFRQTAVVDLIVIIAHQLLMILFQQRKWPEVISFATRLMIGALLPTTVVMLYAQQQEWLAEFFHQAIWWNYQFSKSSTLSLETVTSALLSIEWLPLILMVLAWLPLSYFYSSRTKLLVTCPLIRPLFFMALLGHLIESFASPLWFTHHLMPALMIMTLVATDSLEQIFNVLRRVASVKQIQLVFTIPLLLITILSALVHVSTFNALTQNEPADQALADWIQQQTLVSDSILVWGYAPQIYLLSKRYPASRFHHNLFLSNQSRRFLPLDADFIANFRQDIELKKPKLIILAAGQESYEDLVEYLPQVAFDYQTTTHNLRDTKPVILSRK